MIHAASRDARNGSNSFSKRVESKVEIRLLKWNVGNRQNRLTIRRVDMLVDEVGAGHRIDGYQAAVLKRLPRQVGKSICDTNPKMRFVIQRTTCNSLNNNDLRHRRIIFVGLGNRCSIP